MPCIFGHGLWRLHLLHFLYSPCWGTGWVITLLLEFSMISLGFAPLSPCSVFPTSMISRNLRLRLKTSVSISRCSVVSSAAYSPPSPFSIPVSQILCVKNMILGDLWSVGDATPLSYHYSFFRFLFFSADGLLNGVHVFRRLGQALDVEWLHVIRMRGV